MKARLKKEYFKKYMTKNNIPQNSLAKYLGLTTGHLSQLINGRRYPSGKLRDKIMKKLKITQWGKLFEIVEG